MGSCQSFSYEWHCPEKKYEIKIKTYNCLLFYFIFFVEFHLKQRFKNNSDVYIHYIILSFDKE